jgi:nucleotide-binding universal stress UspA family protein
VAVTGPLRAFTLRVVAARDDHVDVIVMGTQGRDSFGDALCGSTTERVIRHAKCPVLAVPLDHTVVQEFSTSENLATGRLAI